MFGEMCLGILLDEGFLLLQDMHHVINIYIPFGEFHCARVIITVVILCCIKLQMFWSSLKKHISLMCVPSPAWEEFPLGSERVLSYFMLVLALCISWVPLLV